MRYLNQCNALVIIHVTSSVSLKFYWKLLNSSSSSKKGFNIPNVNDIQTHELKTSIRRTEDKNIKSKPYKKTKQKPLIKDIQENKTKTISQKHTRKQNKNHMSKTNKKTKTMSKTGKKTKTSSRRQNHGKDMQKDLNHFKDEQEDNFIRLSKTNKKTKTISPQRQADDKQTKLRPQKKTNKRISTILHRNQIMKL